MLLVNPEYALAFEKEPEIVSEFAKRWNVSNPPMKLTLDLLETGESAHGGIVLCDFVDPGDDGSDTEQGVSSHGTPSRPKKRPSSSSDPTPVAKRRKV